MSPTRFERAVEALDAANRADPNRLPFEGGDAPKEWVHAELATRWVRRLVDEPSEALLLAARGHHLRRWLLPRRSYPDGRSGYLAWRRELQERHARDTGEILKDAGYGDDAIGRVAALIRKRGLGRDPEVQALEDALCLVFVETQLADFAPRHDPDKVVSILAGSLRKMSRAGREAAAALELAPEARALLERAAEGLERDGP